MPLCRPINSTMAHWITANGKSLALTQRNSRDMRYCLPQILPTLKCYVSSLTFYSSLSHPPPHRAECNQGVNPTILWYLHKFKNPQIPETLSKSDLNVFKESPRISSHSNDFTVSRGNDEWAGVRDEGSMGYGKNLDFFYMEQQVIWTSYSIDMVQHVLKIILIRKKNMPAAVYGKESCSLRNR